MTVDDVAYGESESLGAGLEAGATVESDAVAKAPAEAPAGDVLLDEEPEKQPCRGRLRPAPRRSHPVPLPLPPWLKPGLVRRVVIHPAARLVVRSDGVLQFGADPHSGAVLFPQQGENPEKIARTLRRAVEPQSMSKLSKRLQDEGMIASRARHVVQELLRVGVLVDYFPEPLRVMVVGRGAAADAVAQGLATCGVTVVRPGAWESPASMAARIPVTTPVVVVNHPRFEAALAKVTVRRELTVVPVVVDADGATVGPVRWRGVGPCLMCCELVRQRAWEQWPQEADRVLAWADVPAAVGVLDGRAWREGAVRWVVGAVASLAAEAVEWDVCVRRVGVGPGVRWQWLWPGVEVVREVVGADPACPECFTRP